MGADERGNLLLISGVLLVLGFVVLGTTLVQLNSLDGSTALVQRGGIVEELDTIMVELRTSIYDSILTGQTNVTDFEGVMRNLEHQLVQSAARSGIYIALVPTTEEPDVWRRPDRCMGYNVDATERGVVVGWTVEDFEETIAGVVYRVHATDGRQSMDFYYYALIERCADVDITSVYTILTTRLGSIQDAEALRTVGNIATLQEERDLSVKVFVLFHPTIRQETITMLGNWNNPNNILNLDGTYTTMSSNLASLSTQGNHFRFQIAPPAMMKPADSFPNVTLEITAYKNLAWNVLQPQSMYLRIYPQGALVPTVIKEISFPVGAANVATMKIVIPELIPLQGHWSYSDLQTSRWELTVIGIHQPSQHYNIDHFKMTGGMELNPLRLETVLEWQNIPSAYGQHVLEMRYRMAEERTAGESIFVQILDRGTDSWVTLQDIQYTNGGWVEVAIPAPDNTMVTTASWLKPLFRIVDSLDDDYFVPEDQDRLEIEYMRVRSILA